MKKALILYSSVDGQTYKIAKKIADNISIEYCCYLHSVDNFSNINLLDYDLVVLGASIRYGYFGRKFQQFVVKNAAILNELNSAFFSVTLTARKAHRNTPETNTYTQKFLTNSPWSPKVCGVFAGALCYPKYSWYDRLLIRFIMKLSGTKFDKKACAEFTNWQDVVRFSQRLLQ